MYIGTATMENRMEVTQKTENSTTIWSSNSTPGYTSEKKNKNTDSKRYMQPNVHGSIIYNCHGSNLCPSTDEQIKEM